MGKIRKVLADAIRDSKQKNTCPNHKVIRSPLNSNTHTLRCIRPKGHRGKHTDGIILW